MAIKLLDVLIDNQPPVSLEKAEPNGETPLMLAAQKGDLVAVRWLLKHGANLNTVDNLNRHALYHAVLKGQKPVVLELLNHHEVPLLDICSRYWKTWTLLQAAKGDEYLINLLLDAGADPDFRNGWDRPILNIAIEEGNMGLVKLLLEPRRNVDIHRRSQGSWSPILEATKPGSRADAEMVRFLMESGSRLSDTTSMGYSPLHLAAKELKPDILRILLQYHAPDDLTRRTTNGRTPLLEIASFDKPESLECIRLLVRAGSDVNAQDLYGWSILVGSSGSSGQNASSVHDFLLNLPDIKIDTVSLEYRTALNHACRTRNVDLVAKLLEHDEIDINRMFPRFAGTAIIAACAPIDSQKPHSDVEVELARGEHIVRDLVAHGANVDAVAGPPIFNALCGASLFAGPGTVTYLLDKTTSARTPDPHGRLPIHFAAANGIRNFEAVAQAHGDDIMATDIFGKNVLHWAAQFGHLETVRREQAHRVFITDGKAHTFEVMDGEDTEFESSTLPSTRDESTLREQSTASTENTPLDGQDTPKLQDMSLAGDDFEMIDFPVSDDLGGLD
ncbi:hypothetical protein SLS53_007222 [Cytospora paraplurivora]|uniref:Ankyrin n=1 Tax=Cytospora paraplurivora TaxID=2898453 RepID=A0AAN9U454_9PEZI